MFKFNFQVSEENVDAFTDVPTTPAPKNAESEQEVLSLPACEHTIQDSHRERIDDTDFYEMCTLPNALTLKLLDECEISASIISEKEALTQTLHSDLVKGVYEGGLKIWEGSKDLAEYLSVLDCVKESLSVLELGCGAGLPGLVLLHKGANRVDFQDYNPEVIDYYTIPNALLNGGSSSRCRFFSGDWESLLSILPHKMYDLILTSETIYDISNQKKLLKVFDETLKEDGYILLASKIHYFGVGGGLRQFEERLTPKWKCETVKVFNEQGVKREIIKLFRSTKHN